MWFYNPDSCFSFFCPLHSEKRVSPHFVETGYTLTFNKIIDIQFTEALKVKYLIPGSCHGCSTATNWTYRLLEINSDLLALFWDLLVGFSNALLQQHEFRSDVRWWVCEGWRGFFILHRYSSQVSFIYISQNHKFPSEMWHRNTPSVFRPLIQIRRNSFNINNERKT